MDARAAREIAEQISLLIDAKIAEYGKRISMTPSDAPQFPFSPESIVHNISQLLEFQVK